MPFYYLGIFLIICFFALMESVGIDKRIKNLGLITSLSLMFITSAFRYETGVDWIVYLDMLEKIAPISAITTNVGRMKIFQQPDLGYDILTSIIKELGGGIQLVFFIMSAISSYFLYKSLRIYSRYPAITLVVYFCLIFFTLDMSGMRQGVALTIFLYATQFIEKKNFGKYLFFVVLATLFHWSSVLLIPLYPLVRKSYSTVFILFLVLISLIVFFLHIKWLSSVIIFILPYFTANAKLIEKMVVYTSDKSFTGGWDLNFTILFNVFSSLIILLLLLWRRRELETRFFYFRIFFNIYFFQLVLYFSISELSEIAERLRLFFLIANVILIPYLLLLFDRRIQRGLFTCFILIYSFINCRAYILERPATIAHHPYQNYVVYKTLGLESSGYRRLKEHYRIFAKNNR